MKPTIKEIFRSQGFALTKGPRQGRGRYTMLEWIIKPDGTRELGGSRTAPKRALGACYKSLAKQGGWL